LGRLTIHGALCAARHADADAVIDGARLVDAQDGAAKGAVGLARLLCGRAGAPHFHRSALAGAMIDGAGLVIARRGGPKHPG
jgi:hypothetical protein